MTQRNRFTHGEKLHGEVIITPVRNLFEAYQTSYASPKGPANHSKPSFLTVGQIFKTSLPVSSLLHPLLGVRLGVVIPPQMPTQGPWASLNCRLFRCSPSLSPRSPGLFFTRRFFYRIALPLHPSATCNVEEADAAILRRICTVRISPIPSLGRQNITSFYPFGVFSMCFSSSLKKWDVF